MSDALVKVEDVSKKFCTSLRTSLWYGVQDLGAELVGNRHPSYGILRPNEFWAVKNVSFELRRGECLGLVGRNGAGKTTLLRMLSGLIRPDSGQITLRGTMGTIIALGAGFNPVLTGRENIQINAALLGIDKHDLADKTDEIIEFSELGKFIDMPVRHYSSGMNVRLGFAVAVAMKPDILLLDEVLAVGDAAFRFKCHRRILELLEHAAVIFVSHDMAHVARITSQVLVLNCGSPSFQGIPASGIEIYRQLNEAASQRDAGFVNLKEPIQHFHVSLSASSIHPSAPLALRLDIESTRKIGNLALRVNIFNLAGDYAADCVVETDSLGLLLETGSNTWNLMIDAVPLKAGRYAISFSIADSRGDFLAVSHKCHDLEVTGGHPGTVADCQLKITTVQQFPQ